MNCAAVKVLEEAARFDTDGVVVAPEIENG